MWTPVVLMLLVSISEVAYGSLSRHACNCLDIALIIDTSTSINDAEWKQLKDFLAEFMDKFEMLNKSVNFAAINFSSTAMKVFNLDDFTTIAEVKAALDTIGKEGKKTAHSKGLEIALNEVFTDEGGDRNDTKCPDVAIMITDGLNNTGGDAVGIANQMRDKGIKVIVVGIGNNLDIELMEAIADKNETGQPLFLFNDDFASLSKIIDSLFTFACGTLCHVACECLDIAMVIDTSKSINPKEWSQMKQFLQDFTFLFDPNIEDLNFAAINFSSNAELVFNLDQFTTQQEVANGFAEIIPEQKKTRHNRGLQIALDQVFTDEGGDRIDTQCPDVVIMITDGMNNTGGDAIAVADALKSIGVYILAVAIGNNQDIEFLEKLVSNTNEIIQVEDYIQLPDILEPLKTNMCFRECRSLANYG